MAVLSFRRHRKVVCCICALLFLVLVVVFVNSLSKSLFNVTLEERYGKCNPANKDVNSKGLDPGDSSNPIIIWWSGLGDFNRKVIDCPRGNCFVTAAREYYSDPRTAAYLFYATTVCWTDLPLPRQRDRIWAFMHEESPRNNWVLVQEDGLRLFNYSSTFSRYSDFPITTLSLDNLAHLTNFEVVSVEEKNRYRQEGFAPIAYLQSNCNPPSDRETYVAELMRHMQVDSLGKCLHNKDIPSSLSNPLKAMEAEDTYKLLAKYKFVLTFENAICEDYITEKLWRPLHVGAVPVIRGSPSVRDWLPDSEKSAILADDFDSPKELAEFLLALDKDDDKYDEYLRWKREGITNQRLLKDMQSRSWNGDVNAGKDYKPFIDVLECEVCDQAYILWEKKQKGEEIPVKTCSKADYNCQPPKKSVKGARQTISAALMSSVQRKEEWCSRAAASVVYEAVSKGLTNEGTRDLLSRYQCNYME